MRARFEDVMGCICAGYAVLFAALFAALFAVRAAALLVLFGAVAVLLGAFGFQYVGGLPPCELCLYQRIPHAVLIPLAGLAFLSWRTYPRLALLALGLGGFVMLAGAGLAGFHVGVEWQWWAGLSGCSGDAAATSVAELRAQLQGREIVRCDEVAWSLFGVSMAGYNMLVSLGLAGLALESVRRGIKSGLGEQR